MLSGKTWERGKQERQADLDGRHRALRPDKIGNAPAFLLSMNLTVEKGADFMQKLLNSLFVMAPESYLSLDGENVIASIGEKVAGCFPLYSFESILYFGQKGVSPSLMGACAARGINLSFFSPSGEFLAGIQGKSGANRALRENLYKISSDEAASLTVAKGFVSSKIYNTRWIVERTAREYPERVDAVKLKIAGAFLKRTYQMLPEAKNFDALRKMEAEADSCYYGVLDEVILQNKKDFFFSALPSDPPKDPLGAVLSFLYALMLQECTHALEGAGLDPDAGLLHRDRCGDVSLAMDLMEEFRGVICDRLAISTINIKGLNAEHFERQEDGSVFLNKNGRKAILNAWQAKKKETLRHPYLQEKITWGMLPNVQALLLARYIRGELDAYPPFLWK